MAFRNRTPTHFRLRHTGHGMGYVPVYKTRLGPGVSSGTGFFDSLKDAFSYPINDIVGAANTVSSSVTDAANSIAGKAKDLTEWANPTGSNHVGMGMKTAGKNGAKKDAKKQAIREAIARDLQKIF